MYYHLTPKEILWWFILCGENLANNIHSAFSYLYFLLSSLAVWAEAVTKVQEGIFPSWRSHYVLIFLGGWTKVSGLPLPETLAKHFYSSAWWHWDLWFCMSLIAINSRVGVFLSVQLLHCLSHIQTSAPQIIEDKDRHHSRFGCRRQNWHHSPRAKASFAGAQRIMPSTDLAGGRADLSVLLLTLQWLHVSWKSPTSTQPRGCTWPHRQSRWAPAALSICSYPLTAASAELAELDVDQRWRELKVIKQHKDCWGDWARASLGTQRGRLFQVPTGLGVIKNKKQLPSFLLSPPIKSMGSLKENLKTGTFP